MASGCCHRLVAAVARPHSILLAVLVAALIPHSLVGAASAQQGRHKQQVAIPREPATGQQEWNEVCRFYAQSRENMEVEMRGVHNGQCAGPKWHTWWQRASSLCVSCFNRTNVCKNPPVLTFHAYLDGLHYRDWRASLAFLKAFLITQDLRKTRLLLWVSDAEEILNHPHAADFFRAFDRVIEVHTLWWIELVWETPIQVHTLFSNDTLLQGVQPHSPFMDMLRMLALHKHGGVWLDSDVIVLKDLYPLGAKVGYQFSARWPGGNHLLALKQGSPIAWQVMELLAELPEEEDDIIDKLKELCRANKFSPRPGLERSIPEYLNGCIMPLAEKNAVTAAQAVGNATGPLHQLHEVPLAWFDPVQHKCLDVRADLNSSAYLTAMQRYVAVQSRYPAIPHAAYPIGARSLMGRTLDSIEQYFEQCADWGCFQLKPVDVRELVSAQERQQRSGSR